MNGMASIVDDERDIDIEDRETESDAQKSIMERRPSFRSRGYTIAGKLIVVIFIKELSDRSSVTFRMSTHCHLLFTRMHTVELKWQKLAWTASASTET